MTEAVEELCAIRRRLGALTEPTDPAKDVAAEIAEIVKRLDLLIVPASITIEALNPVFETEGGSRGHLDVLTLCYNAFMHGRNGLPQDREAARVDWFNDTHPLMLAGVERIQRECVRRMEYAKEQEARAAFRRTPSAQ